MISSRYTYGQGVDKCQALAHPLPTLAALATTSSPLQQQDLGDHNHGRLRRHRVRQDPRSSPPPPIPHCTLTRARLRSQPTGQPRLQPGEKQHRKPGRDKRLRDRSEHTGIAVKSRRNPGQVFQESPSSAQESAGAVLDGDSAGHRALFSLWMTTILMRCRASDEERYVRLVRNRVDQTEILTADIDSGAIRKEGIQVARHEMRAGDICQKMKTLFELERAGDRTTVVYVTGDGEVAAADLRTLMRSYSNRDAYLVTGTRDERCSRHTVRTLGI